MSFSNTRAGSPISISAWKVSPHGMNIASSKSLHPRQKADTTSTSRRRVTFGFWSGSAAMTCTSVTDAHLCVRTDHPVAVGSPDHVRPRGTALDNSRNHRFNRKLYRLFAALDRPIRILDLGCAGGGFVHDCLSDGHIAVGIEGSDYSARWGRAEWPLLGGRSLFTADITKPFEIARIAGAVGTPLTYADVCLWDVLEHIGEADLPAVFRNIASHLEPGGLMIASISSEVLAHHQTVRDESWWREMFLQQQLILVPEITQYFATQFIRGPKYGAVGSFHVIATNDRSHAPTVPPVRVVAYALDHVWYGRAPYRWLRRFLGIE